ncbi:hypothetical protein [Mesorhizobium sp. WSM2239]|uniref:WGR domain-containing protein n=2 Tax=unclassified Mesorhizobium TaxID=325217 RepID=A0AAU8DEI8_9HYPH
MTRRSGGPSPARIDREWRYQVALPDDLCVGRNFALISDFRQAHGLEHMTRHVTAVWPGGIRQERYRLHCFADLESAETFKNEFGGVIFDPKLDRESGRVRGAWHRTDEYKRFLESGPLAVPETLRN